MFEAFSFSFLTIFLAEFLDKSQLTILLLGTKTKRHIELLSGVLLAFIIVDGSAIFFGSVISHILPPLLIHILAGVLFIVFGILSLRPSDEKTKQDDPLHNPFISGFTLVFFSEWGDKTQIAAALFAVKYPPFYVFLGVISALFLLSILAVTVGSKLMSRIKRQTVSTISGIVFIALGILFLLS
jgi:putative Ca2+/H+ antiporter (TMEM165/GDT1 family)